MKPAPAGADVSQSTRPVPTATPSPTPRESSGTSAITPRRDSKRSADSRPLYQTAAKRVTRESLDSQQSDRAHRYELGTYSVRTYADFAPPPHGGPSPSASFRSLPGLRHQSWAQLAELAGVERHSFTSQIGESGGHTWRS